MVKFLTITTDDQVLSRVQANVAEALRQMDASLQAAISSVVASSGASTSVGAFGATPNANGAVISGNVLRLEPADATNPGGISTTTQNIPGPKTFTAASLDLNNSNNGDTTLTITNTNSGTSARIPLFLVGNGGRYCALISYPVGWTSFPAFSDTAVWQTQKAGGWVFDADGPISGTQIGFRWLRDATTQLMSLDYTTGGLGFPSTDLSGTPGAAVINKPSGRAAIAIGSSTVTITCNVVAAGDQVIVTGLGRDATCRDLVVDSVGGGSFVVSGSAVATAATKFMFLVIKAT